MKKYTITSKKYHSFTDGKSTFIVTIVVDKETDIPEPPKDEWAPGSMCQIAGTHQYKVLNNERKWE